MVLRLLLVSIVAGLGVTPPAESEVAGWSCTVQTWLDARLAEWDVTQPPDDGHSGPALSLTEDLDAAVLEQELMGLFDAQPSAAAAVPAPVAVERGADRDFEAIVEEMAAEFSQDQTGSGEPEAKVALVPPAAMDAEADPADLEAEIVAAELETGEISPNVPAPAMANLPAGEDELFQIANDFDQRVSLELTRQTPEQTAPAPLDEEAPAARATAANPLRDAVRLTRDALYAWINLLQSPALVTVPQ
jgi:hypothetical protein